MLLEQLLYYRVDVRNILLSVKKGSEGIVIQEVRGIKTAEGRFDLCDFILVNTPADFEAKLLPSNGGHLDVSRSSRKDRNSKGWNPKWGQNCLSVRGCIVTLCIFYIQDGSTIGG